MNTRIRLPMLRFHSGKFFYLLLSLFVLLILIVAGAFLYGLVDLVYPGSFIEYVVGADSSMTHNWLPAHLENYIYFSFTTLTTLGYGDIVPVSQAARVFAYLEAVMGQVYLTVLVARLVALHISQTRG